MYWDDKTPGQCYLKPRVVHVRAPAGQRPGATMDCAALWVAAAWCLYLVISYVLGTFGFLELTLLTVPENPPGDSGLFLHVLCLVFSLICTLCSIYSHHLISHLTFFAVPQPLF